IARARSSSRRSLRVIRVPALARAGRQLAAKGKRVATNEYHFITHWRVHGTVAEVAEVLRDPLELPRWWPAVYLDVRELKPGDENGVGRDIDLVTRGWLPYTLRWQFTVTEVRSDGFTLRARGDFDGRGIWTFVPDGE